MHKTRGALQPDLTYHIFNRGNNRENVFIEDRNYTYFHDLFALHISPVADTYAFCMLRNHFHVLLRVRPLDALMDLSARKPPFKATVAAACDMPSRAFCAFFTAYSQGINKAHSRTGRLFAPHFGRLVVDNENYFSTVLRYIHRNPVHHGFVEDLRDWPWSSFHAMTTTRPTWLARNAVLDRFGSVQAMIASHSDRLDPEAIAVCIGDDPAE